MTLYPTSPADLAALMAALAPLVIWAISGLLKVIIEAQDRQIRRWDRLITLAQILYNKDNEYGAWKQVIAASELGRQIVRRNEALMILMEAKIFWNEVDISPALQRAVDASIYRLQRPVLLNLLS